MGLIYIVGHNFFFLVLSIKSILLVKLLNFASSLDVLNAILSTDFWILSKDLEEENMLTTPWTMVLRHLRGFQLLDLIITELKSHMTCYNSMPLIG